MVRSVHGDNGVWILLCDCGGELQKRLDFKHLKQSLSASDAVSSVLICSDVCDSGKCIEVLKPFVNSGAKRLIIGGCAKERYERALREAFDTIHMNDGLWWPVNTVEECSLVHKNKRVATTKAEHRLLAAVERVLYAEPVTSMNKTVQQNVVVIGTGIAGLQAAVTLEKLGHHVSLVGRDGDPGGAAAAMPEVFAYTGNEPDDDGAVSRFIEGLVAQVKNSKSIRLFPETTLTSISGEPGDFALTAASNGDSKTLRAGAIVLAPGSNRASNTQKAAGGAATNIIDIPGLLAMIRAGKVPPRIAILMDMIHEQDRSVSAQVFSAAEMAVRLYGAHVTVFCAHVRVAACGLERLYRRARNAGVVVIKSDTKPVIFVESRGVTIVSEDPIIPVALSYTFDIAVAGDQRTTGENHRLAQMAAGLKQGPDDALQYDNVWLAPVSTNRPGVFVIGGARGNSEYREALMDGMAVAGEIHILLGEGQMEVRGDAALVDSDRCVLCLTCLRDCPHGAIRIDTEKGAASISPVSCQRCGICAAECPADAITLPRFTDEQITAEIGRKPRVTVFACENSAIPAADKAGMNGYMYTADVEIIRVPCAGRVDSRTVLAALEKGAEKVLVLGCHPESCKYLTGSSRTAKRINRLATMLGKAGFDSSRVSFGGIAAMEPRRFVDYVTAK